MSRRDDEVLLYAGAAALLGLAVWKGPQIADGVAQVAAGVVVGAGYVTNMFTRGNKLYDSTVDAAGVVTDDPDVLRMQAEAVLGYAADLDTLALATMGRSEGVDGMEARMHIALNHLDELQRQYGTGVYSSISALMLHSKNPAADGHFSEQYLGKWASTSKAAYEGDYHLAEKVRADRANGIDITDGALRFVDKDAFSSQRGATKTYAQVVAKWGADGYVPGSVADATDNFVVFRRA